MSASIRELINGKVLFAKNGFAQGIHNEDGDGVPHLRPFNVSAEGDLDLRQIKYVSAPEPGGPYWLQPGDVIFNNTNTEDLVGKTAYFDLEDQVPVVL